jgi:hypothetical protein
MIYEPVRYAVWGQGFGEFERRTGSGVVPPPVLGLGLLGGTPINMSQSVTTWGFNGGADATFRNNWWVGDILIAGLLTGYMSSDMRFSTGTLTGHVEGPSFGGYVTYLSGPWTTELLGRVDFLRLSENFSETLAFTGGATAAIPISGSASTGLNDYIAAGNVYYKIIDAYTWWLEPTAGFRFTQSSYDGSAAALGLASGHAWRVQGGLRLAGNYFWGGALVTPSITGLVYDDVDVTGLVVTGGQFNSSPIIPLDQAKVRGQGILALNFDYGNGVSAYVSGDVHGGSNGLAPVSWRVESLGSGYLV